MYIITGNIIHSDNFLLHHAKLGMHLHPPPAPM